MTGREKRWVAAAGVLCALSLLALGVVWYIRSQTPSFQPPAFDPTARTGTPTVAAAYQWTPLEVTDGYIVSLCAKPVAEGDRAVVYFTAAQDNQVWVRLQLFTQTGELLGESGVVRSGEYVEQLSLTQPITQDTPVVMQVVAYTPETWYSAGKVQLNATLTAAP